MKCGCTQCLQEPQLSPNLNPDSVALPDSQSLNLSLGISNIWGVLEQVDMGLER